MDVSVLMATAVVLGGAATAQNSGPPGTTCRDLDRVSYSAPQPDRLKSVSIVREAPTAERLAPLEKASAPHKTAHAFIARPDYSKPGPWTTRVYVVGNAARPLGAEVRFEDHAHYHVKVSWINEKLVHFNVFWGRILATELIVDVETWSFVYAEDANYGLLVMPCEDKRGAAPK